MDWTDPTLLSGLGFLGLCFIGFLWLVLRPRSLPPPAAELRTAERPPAPGELGQQLAAIHRQIIERHDAQALEAMVGQAGSQLQGHPLLKAMQAAPPPPGPASAPKPPASA